MEFSPFLFKNQLLSWMVALCPVATVSLQLVALPCFMALPDESRMVMTRRHLQFLVIRGLKSTPQSPTTMCKLSLGGICCETQIIPLGILARAAYFWIMFESLKAGGDAQLYTWEMLHGCVYMDFFVVVFVSLCEAHSFRS